jgi:hypothetical protein
MNDKEAIYESYRAIHENVEGKQITWDDLPTDINGIDVSAGIYAIDEYLQSGDGFDVSDVEELRAWQSEGTSSSNLASVLEGLDAIIEYLRSNNISYVSFSDQYPNSL